MSCSGTIWILFMGTLECARVVEVILRLTDGSIPAPPFDLVMARAERLHSVTRVAFLSLLYNSSPVTTTFIWIVHEQLSQILFH